MTKPIIRVTQLEAFRRYLTNGEHSYYEITEESVIESITGAFKGNCKTRIGSAFHSLVENMGADTKREMLEDGFLFDIDGHEVTLSTEQIQTALRYRKQHPQAFHEIRLSKDYGRAIVTGCADMIDGIELRDIKTRFSAPSDADYMDSVQWRFYLDIFGANTFHYDVFVFSGYSDKHQHDARRATLTPHTPPITCYRYPTMESDCRDIVNAFMDWAESRDLVKYLPPNNYAEN